MLDFLGDLRRSHTCGELRASDAGKPAVLMGWVARRRDLGNLIFVDVRDRTGITQVVFDREAKPELHAKAYDLRNEYVVAIIGQVRERQSKNPHLSTGEVEVIAAEMRLLNDAKTPPFLPAETVTANEDLRLKYRYIDLRRGPLQANVELRHKVALAIRNYLSGRGFFEIETPFMTRSTPEGARDYLVPSRIYPGQFYALPQSPQLFKQILMISGFDKYFQIVRCFRDEDLRADRQPEFTQIDLEMSFPQQERVFEVVEGFLTAAWGAAGAKIETPFPRMTYDEAMRLYGIDKPDLRLPALADVRECLTPESKQTLALDAELPIVAIRIPKVGELSRKEREENKILFAPTLAKSPRVGHPEPKLLDDIKRLEKSWPEAVAAIRQKCGAGTEDFLAIVGGAPMEERSALKMRAAERAVYTAAGGFRLEIGRKYAERHGAFAGDAKSAEAYRFLWVTDFPMFEWDEGEQRWQAAHHPFTSPRDQDMDKLESDPGAVRALAYDVVLNGTELGSGSIRIHRQDIQSLIFKALGMSKEEAESRFGFFLEALQYGTPPHGGIALGLDRIVMILAGADSLREVIPFPKTAKAQDLMVDAPTPVSEAQLKDLGISVRAPKEQPNKEGLERTKFS
jgi:aspartyl-tRNA synthetase